MWELMLGLALLIGGLCGFCLPVAAPRAVKWLSGRPFFSEMTALAIVCAVAIGAALVATAVL